MKKHSITLALVISCIVSFGQHSNSTPILIRHDTILLKASDCEWVIKSLTKNDPLLTTEIGKPISLILLEAIEKGKLKAVDRVTNKPIPGKEIFTWHMPVDTVAGFDNSGNAKYVLIRERISPDHFNQVRVFQDLYMDLTTRKLQSVIKWIELLEEVHTHDSGIFIGYRPFCRIYY